MRSHRSSRTTTRVVALVVLGVLAVALTVGLLRLGSRPDPSADAPPAAVAASPGRGAEVEALAVLHAWDEARSRAYASGSVRDLRRLYVAGSRAGVADGRVLRRYLDRGLRVEGLRMQVLDVDVLARDPRRWRLRVTDRVGSAVAVRDDIRWPLPRDAASTRTVELRREDGRWRVAAVTGLR